VVAALQADPRIEWLDSQTHLYDEELNLRGHHDGRIRIIDTVEPDGDGETTRAHRGRIEVIEVKSINSNAMRYAKELPRNYHVLQICSYIGMMRRSGVPVDSGRVIYVSKDNWLLEERGITLTDSRWQLVLDEVDALNELYEAGTLPRRLPSKEKTFKRGPRKGMTVIEKAWKCGYCEFADTVCFPAGREAPSTIEEVRALTPPAELPLAE
jgi:CRISPR/Cas system-associated exonuclease Cas4 (RecB family)